MRDILISSRLFWRRMELFFNIRSVSWIRGADSHIITVDQETFISDSRFSSLIKARENLWTLKVRERPPVGGDSADWIFSDQVCDGQRRGEVWVSSEHGAQDEQEGGAGGGCSQGWFLLPPLSPDSNISSRSEYSVAPTSTWGSSAPYTWSASSVPPSSAPSSWCGNTTGSWSLGPAWSRSRTLHPPPVPLWALVEWTDTKLGTTQPGHRHSSCPQQGRRTLSSHWPGCQHEQSLYPIVDMFHILQIHSIKL